MDSGMLIFVSPLIYDTNGLHLRTIPRDSSKVIFRRDIQGTQYCRS